MLAGSESVGEPQDGIAGCHAEVVGEAIGDVESRFGQDGEGIVDMPADVREAGHQRWRKAIDRTLNWV